VHLIGRGADDDANPRVVEQGPAVDAVGPGEGDPLLVGGEVREIFVAVMDGQPDGLPAPGGNRPEVALKTRTSGVASVREE
jgi:hypothetical protein